MAASKAIKIEQDVYIALEAMRVKGETFSRAIERLLQIYLALKGAQPLLEGMVALREAQAMNSAVDEALTRR